MVRSQLVAKLVFGTRCVFEELRIIRPSGWVGQLLLWNDAVSLVFRNLGHVHLNVGALKHRIKAVSA